MIPENIVQIFAAKCTPLQNPTAFKLQSLQAEKKMKYCLGSQKMHVECNMMMFRLKLLDWLILGLEFFKANTFTFIHVVETQLGVKFEETAKLYSRVIRSDNNMEIIG